MHLLRIAMTGLVLQATSLMANQRNYLHDHWTAVGEFLYMKRAHANDNVLAIDLDKVRSCGECDDFSVLTTQQLVHSMDYEPGYRVGLSYLPNYWMTLEGRFLHLSTFTGEGHVKGTRLRYPFCDVSSTVDYFQANDVQAVYKTHFWTAELNYWWNMTPRWVDYFSLSVIAGLRYFNETESLEDTYTRYTLAQTPNNQKSSYSTNVQNNIGGFQLGLNLQINPMSYFSWEMNAKVGFMEAYVKAHDVLKDQNDTVVISDWTGGKWRSGFFSDLSAAMVFSFLKHFDAHIGYEFLFLKGFGAAADQLPHCAYKENHKVNTNAGMYIYGLFAGIGVSF